MKQWMLAGLMSGLMVGMAAVAAAQDAVRMEKVDPPNWWAGMPAPMLLVKGEGLMGAAFTVSDAALRVEKVVPSANGHWAQVWLSASPKQPETVTLRAQRGGERAEVRYVFGARKKPDAGFAGFNARDVMYLIMTDRFADGDLTNDGAEGKSAAESAEAKAQKAMERGWHGGDLRGVGQHLEYLRQLGVTAVWTTPVYQNHQAMSYHGYGATDLYAVDEHYGSMADLQALSGALHAKGMKLVLDTVPNHVGPKHPWVMDPPAPDWFHGSAEQHEEAESDFTALMNPHASARDRRATLQGWFANALPDMDTENAAVAQYLRQNAVWWIEETGADALRIDTFPYVDRAFWHGFDGELKELYPQLTEVGETFDADPVFVSSYAGGVTRTGVDTELYTPFDFPTYFAVREVFLKGKPMTKLNEVLAQDALYPHPERLPVFLGNHDVPRFAEEEPNEAAGRLAFAYVMTTRGMPQIYSGDEIAMKGKGDPDNRHDFPVAAFTAAGRTAEQAAMFDWVSGLAKVRAEHVALACGAEQVLDVTEDWLVVLRDGARSPDAGCGPATKERVLVAMKRGAAAAKTVAIDETWMQGCRLGKPVWDGKGSSAVVSGDDLRLTMAKDDVLIAACE